MIKSIASITGNPESSSTEEFHKSDGIFEMYVYLFQESTLNFRPQCLDFSNVILSRSVKRNSRLDKN